MFEHQAGLSIKYYPMKIACGGDGKIKSSQRETGSRQILMKCKCILETGFIKLSVKMLDTHKFLVS